VSVTGGAGNEAVTSRHLPDGELLDDGLVRLLRIGQGETGPDLKELSWFGWGWCRASQMPGETRSTPKVPRIIRGGTLEASRTRFLTPEPPETLQSSETNHQVGTFGFIPARRVEDGGW